MEYTSIHSAIISILSAVITGGFVLIFVEISNRKNRENDKYRQLMTPFMRKLSAYFKYINWVQLHITNPKPDTDIEKKYKKFLRYDIGNYGSQLIVDGGRYDVESFNALMIVSFLHRGQYRGKFNKTVSSLILILVLFLHFGQITQ